MVPAPSLLSRASAALHRSLSRVPPFRHAAVRVAAAALCLAAMLVPQPAAAYSVLSHEQVVDLAWKPYLVPLLEARYPGLTPDQLKEAHAYAYGGAIIQDIGYYPFGSHMLSDLLHYVRSGDFVTNLLKESTNADEYAFALGALAHYTSDRYGHPEVNRATAQEYPKLRRRYGPVVTYDESPRAHLQTEFGFDVLEVVQQRYAPEAYHDFIGFQVSKPVFERAFQDTYGVELKDVLTHEDLAIGSYRHTVSNLLPQMTKVAVVDYKKQIEKSDPAVLPRHLLYRLNRADYEKTWGKSYQRPNFGERTLALFLRMLPKVGPLHDLSLRIPTPQTQQIFLTGFNTVAEEYEKDLARLRSEPVNSPPRLDLSNRDLDTGKLTKPGEYALADQTYVKYLDLLTKHGQQPLPPAVRASVVDFFNTSNPATLAVKGDQARELAADLQEIRGGPPVSGAPPLATAAGKNPGAE